MGRLGGKLLSPAGIVILVCFFLPWVTVSCSGNQTAMTKVTGYTILTGNAQQRVESNSEFYLIIGSAVVLIILGLILWHHRSVGASVVALLASLVVLGQTLFFYFRLPEAIAETAFVSVRDISIEWHPAFWATVVAGVVAVLGSLASFNQDSGT